MTSKQRAYLRGLANPLQAKYQIGKGGVEEGFLRQIDDALEANELIKITILETALLSTREAAALLCAPLCAESVQMIGNKIVLYRESKKHKKITLP